MTEYQVTRSQNEAVLLVICQKLEENVRKINSEMKEERLEIESGDIINRVGVREYDSERDQVDRICFELFLDSGSLRVWYQEGMIRWNQPGGMVIDEGSDSLLIWYKEEPLPIEEMVDRVFKQWLEKKWKIEK